jgi:hypothetical protein
MGLKMGRAPLLVLVIALVIGGGVATAVSSGVDKALTGAVTLGTLALGIWVLYLDRPDVRIEIARIEPGGVFVRIVNHGRRAVRLEKAGFASSSKGERTDRVGWENRTAGESSEQPVVPRPFGPGDVLEAYIPLEAVYRDWPLHARPSFVWVKDTTGKVALASVEGIEQIARLA